MSWWRDRSQDPFLSVIGADIKAAVMALVPLNKHLRLIDDTLLNPVAVAAAYNYHRKWKGPKDDVMCVYTAELAVLMTCAPPVQHNRDAVKRSHEPEAVSALDRSQYAQVSSRVCILMS